MPYRLAIAQEIKKGWVQGFEPWTFRATIWRADQLCYTHHNAKVISYWPWLIKKSVPGGIRTLDPRLRRPLLYPAELRTHKAGDGNRTHVISLEGWSSTIELHPLTVGVTGFEPATSWSQIKRSSQAEPHPVSALLFLYFINSKIYYIESSFKCQQLFSTFFIFLEHFVANPLFMRFLILFFLLSFFIFLRLTKKIIGKSR